MTDPKDTPPQEGIAEAVGTARSRAGEKLEKFETRDTSAATEAHKKHAAQREAEVVKGAQLVLKILDEDGRSERVRKKNGRVHAQKLADKYIALAAKPPFTPPPLGRRKVIEVIGQAIQAGRIT